MNTITPELIQQMSYPDFIGTLGLENTSLGGSFAVDYWIHNSNLNKNSNILEIACSTGFNIRYCVKKLATQGVGIDISDTSIQSAIEKSKQEKIDMNVRFKLENAEQLSFQPNIFTHVIAGMSFAFIKNSQLAIKEASRVLSSDGYLLTATPYYKKQPSGDLLNQLEKTFGFHPSNSWNFYYWKNFFSRFFILKNETSIFRPSPPFDITSIKSKIVKFVFEENQKIKNCTELVKHACVGRLLQIQLVINENSQYQIGKLQVWQNKSSNK